MTIGVPIVTCLHSVRRIHKAYSKFVFWGVDPENLVAQRFDLQKEFSCAERRVQIWCRSDVQCDLWAWQRKEKKTVANWHLPRSPTSPDRSQSLRAGWPPVCSSAYQDLLKSVQWFCRCGWLKLALFHYFGIWLIQQLVLS